MPKSKTRAAAGPALSGRRLRGTRPRSARATGRKGQAVDDPSGLLPGQEDRSPLGPSTAVPGGLVPGDLPGPAAPPEFGESVADVAHVPDGAQPHAFVSSPVTTNTNAIAGTSSSSPSVRLISYMPVSAAQLLSGVHDHPPFWSVCDELGLGVPKQIQEKIWNGMYVILALNYGRSVVDMSVPLLRIVRF